MTDFTNDKSTQRSRRPVPSDEDFNLDNVNTLDALQNSETKDTVTNPFAHSESLMPSMQAASQIKTSFYVDYFDKRKQADTSVTQTPMPEVEENLYSENVSLDKIESESVEEESEDEFFDDEAPIVNGAGMAVAILSQFKSKQESVNRQQEKLIQELTKKNKSTRSTMYIALLFALVALAAAAGLGMMLFQTKTEFADLAGTTVALKDEIRNLKGGFPDELEGTDPSLDAITQKVDEMSAQIADIGELQDKIAMLEKELAVKSLAKPLDETTKTTASISNKASANIKPVKTAKPVNQTPVTAKTAVTNAQKSNKTTAPVTKTNTEQELPANDINRVVNTANAHAISGANKPSTNAATKPAASSASGWTVNLASSNRLDEAKKTAARFADKGVPVTISHVMIKNQPYYRLQVKGFKSKEDATAYANKAKSALNLPSVWVNP